MWGTGLGMRFARCANAHLSDDEAVAKMGHPVNMAGLLSPVDEDLDGRAGGLLERGEDEEALAVVGDHKGLSPARGREYGGSFEEEPGDTGFEGCTVRLHVHCKVAIAEVKE